MVEVGSSDAVVVGFSSAAGIGAAGVISIFSRYVARYVDDVSYGML
jgi:hypothetical protein